MAEIRCRECWYCVETPYKHRPDNDWCRMTEKHMPKDNVKVRCKHYESREQVERTMKEGDFVEV